ncbi:MAG: murein biosynthesis integral membrane protein MurJ, partial [Candidatus Pacebacteria bacterium CG10_big_fil_rev_8_21_14_0_10_45_6]
MIKQLFSSQSKTITGAAIILGVASFVSRLVGILRDRVLAHHFGAGDVLDAYYSAFRIPDLLFNLLIAGALSAGFIPVFLEIWKKDKQRAWDLTNSLLSLVLICFAIASVILYAVTPSMMRALVPGFDAQKLDLTISLTRIMLLSPIFLAISSVISSVLHSLKNFMVFAISPILYNLGIIAGVVFFVPRFGVTGLAWGVVLGALLHVGIQIPALIHQGFSYRPLLNIKDTYVKKIVLLTIPRTLGLATHQINLLVVTLIASGLSAGSVTIFHFANNLQYFPIGLIGHSFAIAAFPTMAALVAEGRTHQMIEHLSRTIRQILFLIIPATIIFLLLRAQIVRVILGS